MDDQLPAEVNPQWWVEVDDRAGRFFLSYNPHTSPGRMGVWGQRQSQWILISKSEIAHCSEESKAWIQGYLAGSEPEPHEMFGEGIYDVEDDDPRWERWRSALKQYRREGSWSYDPWQDHLFPLPSDASLPAYVWIRRGDEIWRWLDGQWVLADPQPELVGGLIEKSQCALRGHCDLSMITSVHAVCDDCGATTFTVPAEFTLEEWKHEQYHYVPTLDR